MKRLLVATLCALIFALLASTRGVAAADIKEAPPSCSHAHAILGWSDFKQGKEETDEDFEDRRKRPWLKMGWVVGRLNWACDKRTKKCGRKDPPRLTMANDYKPGDAGTIAFKEYRVKGRDNGKAYVVHCGAGATCNMLASRLFRNYKGIGTPRVYCGKNALPKMLHSPSRPKITIPSDEELNEGLGDDDFSDEDLDDEF